MPAPCGDICDASLSCRFSRSASLKLLRYASPQRWLAFVASRVEVFRRNKSDDELDDAWAKLGPITTDPKGWIVVADGLWFNPGYFLRLRLFLLALARQHPIRLLGILRHRSDARSRRALERIGFRDFIYIGDDSEFPISRFVPEATRLLAGARTHAELLDIELPEGVLSYVWYDTVLHNLRHGQPAVSHVEWRNSLAEILAFIEIYRRLFRDYDVHTLAISHGWKNEFGALLWMALKRGISAHCVTQVSEAIRIRRFRQSGDFDIPVEHLPYDRYLALPEAVKAQLIAIGKKELARRQGSTTSDINIRHAYVVGERAVDRASAREKLGVTDDRPIGVIYGHAWFDFPHLYAMTNFTDFVDWFRQTLNSIRRHDHVQWFLKPHPMEVWYGGQTMADIVEGAPAHVRMLPHRIDTLSVMRAADAIVSIHGTSSMEAAAMGTPVICADRSYYSDWGFAHCAKSASHFDALLAQVGQLSPPTEHQRDLAVACFVGAYGEPHDWASALRVPCDSLGHELFDQVKDMIRLQGRELEQEISRIDTFLRQDQFHSYSAWLFKQAAAGDLSDRRPVSTAT